MKSSTESRATALAVVGLRVALQRDEVTQHAELHALFIAGRQVVQNQFPDG